MSVQMVDLALTPEETKDMQPTVITDAEAPKYPYGLSISLDEKTLEKIGVDHGDWEVGDVFPVDVLLKVTGKNINENQDGEKCCINMQIIAMGAEEAEEEDENEDGEDAAAEHLPLEKHGYLRYNP